MYLKPNKEKIDLNLAPHEWASIYKSLDSIIKDGAYSIRHLEGAVLVILDTIKNRTDRHVF